MATLVEIYFRLLKGAVAILLGAMVILVFGNVVLRYAFDSGITMSEELSRWIFVWLIFLGAIIGMREHAHIGMDSLVQRLGPAGKKLCFAASHLLMLYATVLIIHGSWEQMVINANILAPASGLPLSIFYAAGMFFGVSTFIILAAELYRFLRGRLPLDQLVGVRESEEL